MSQQAALKAQPTPSPQSSGILVLLNAGPPNLFKELLTTKSSQIVQSKSETDTLERANHHSHAVIVTTVRELKDLRALARIAVPLQKRVQAGLIKLVAVDAVDDPKAIEVLKKIGFSEILKTDINPKTLRTRVLQLCKIVESVWKAQHKAENTSSPETEQKPDVKHEEALHIESDYWLTSPDMIRTVRDMWIITVAGPSPSIGRWTRDTRGKDAEQSWRWTLNRPEDAPFTESGAWTFFGRKPTFLDDRWTFIGSQPKLSFLNEEKEVAVRFFTDPAGALHVAENSKVAIKNAAWIQASLKNFRNFEQGAKAETVIKKPAKPEPQQQARQNPGIKDLTIPEERITLYKEVQKKLKKRDQLFSLVKSKFKREKCWQESVETTCAVTVWTDRQKLRIDSICEKPQAHNQLGVRFPSHLNEKSFRAELERLAPKHTYFNVKLKHTSIFFATSPEQVKIFDKGIAIERPEDLFEVQRRSSFRYNVPNRSLIEIKLGESEVSYPLENISSGGLCFICPPEKRFRIGDSIADMRIQVYGKWVQFSVEVRWTKNIAENKGFKIGVRFLKISADDRERIHLFVMEESYDYLKKYV